MAVGSLGLGLGLVGVVCWVGVGVSGCTSGDMCVSFQSACARLLNFNTSSRAAAGALPLLRGPLSTAPAPAPCSRCGGEFDVAAENGTENVAIKPK